MAYRADEFKKKFGAIVKVDALLSRYTTFKIGGPAKLLIEPKTNEQLMEVFAYTKASGAPYFILGGGSNILMSDEGFDGVVIKPRNTALKIEGDTVYVEAGVVLGKLATESAKAGLTGLEWGIAVPGNVGGAVRGNAGAFGGEIKDTLVSAQVYDGKELRTYSNKEMEFVYRGSRVKRLGGQEIVVSATFRLFPGDPKPAMAKVKELLDKKFAAQPMGERCAGCLFKNIEVDGATKQLRPRSKGQPTDAFMSLVPAEFWTKGTVPAGWLIEQSGLKGYKKGDVKVSEKHANFVINIDKATARDVRDFANEIREKVKAKFGVELEEEVEVLR